MAKNKDGARPGNKKDKNEMSAKSAAMRSSPLIGALATLLVFILLIGAVVCFYMFNLFGFRGAVVEFLDVADEAHQRNMEKLAQWQTDLQTEADQLELEQKKVSSTEQELAKNEAAVKKKEDELTSRIAEYDDLLTQLKPKNDDILSVAKALGSMNAEAAGAVLLEMSDKDTMLRLFSLLDSKAQAAILETLDVRTAAALVEGIS